eukprot:COSAG02_NODE_964_length_15595_cov_7.284709_1_plen_138_part_00
MLNLMCLQVLYSLVLPSRFSSSSRGGVFWLLSFGLPSSSLAPLLPSLTRSLPSAPAQALALALAQAPAPAPFPFLVLSPACALVVVPLARLAGLTACLLPAVLLPSPCSLLSCGSAFDTLAALVPDVDVVACSSPRF